MIIHYMYACNNFVLANEYDVEFLINTSVIFHYWSCWYIDLKNDLKIIKKIICAWKISFNSSWL